MVHDQLFLMKGSNEQRIIEAHKDNWTMIHDQLFLMKGSNEQRIHEAHKDKSIIVNTYHIQIIHRSINFKISTRLYNEARKKTGCREINDLYLTLAYVKGGVKHDHL